MEGDLGIKKLVHVDRAGPLSKIDLDICSGEKYFVEIGRRELDHKNNKRESWSSSMESVTAGKFTANFLVCGTKGRP